MPIYRALLQLGYYLLSCGLLRGPAVISLVHVDIGTPTAGVRRYCLACAGWVAMRVRVEQVSTVVVKTTPPHCFLRPVTLRSLERPDFRFFFAVCCCRRDCGCCCSGCCACVGTRAAFALARLQLSSGPARESMPVGLGTRGCTRPVGPV